MSQHNAPSIKGDATQLLRDIFEGKIAPICAAEAEHLIAQLPLIERTPNFPFSHQELKSHLEMVMIQSGQELNSTTSL